MKSNNKANNTKYTPILAKMGDISQINDIIISFWGENSIYDNQFYQDVFKQNLSYVYKNGREIITVCLVSYSKEYEDITIDLLCVKEGYQRKGLGKTILEFCINNCIKKKYYKFYLNVATTNRKAINLYKKLGFHVIKYVRNYYDLDEPPHKDAYLMILEKKEENCNDIINKVYKNDNNDLNSNKKYNNYKNNYTEKYINHNKEYNNNSNYKNNY